MYKSKLIESLRMLSAREWNSFEDFANSPFFNKHEKSRELVGYLSKELRSSKESGLNRVDIFNRIYPKQKFHLQKLKDLFSQVMDLFDVYLEVQAMEDRKMDSRINGLYMNFKKGLTKNYKSNFNRIEKLLEDTPERDIEYHFRKFRFHEIEDEYLMRKDDRADTHGLQSKVDHLDLFYLSLKLKESCNMLNRMNVHGGEYTLRNIEEMIVVILDDWKYYSQFPAITLYYHAWLTLTEPSEEKYFRKYKSLLKKFAHQFSAREARELYAYARNYCTKKINSGNQKYLDELFSIYQNTIDNGLIHENGIISEWALKNMVTIASRLGNYNWAEQLLETQKDYLSEESRENAYSYNMASLFYGQGKYGEAMELLQKVTFTDVYYQLGARSTLLKIYYESDEIELLFSLCDSFKIFLLRSKTVSAYQKKVHQNLIRFTRKLGDLKDRKEILSKSEFKMRHERLTQEIERTKNITNLSWLRGVLKSL